MISTHQDQLRLRLTAFFFNNRADALRGEMYRALCLLALANADEPKSIDDIAQEVISMLGGTAGQSKSIGTVLSDELSTLLERAEVSKSEQGYMLTEDSGLVVPDEAVEARILEEISEEIKSIALSITPNLSIGQLGRLEQFFFESSVLIAKNRLPFLASGEGVSYSELSDEDLATAVSDLRVQFEIDQFTDTDKFINHVFIRPSPLIGDFLHSLYQVTVITALLGWDPSLAYLQNRVLARISLYLDSNIFFDLMQQSSPFHEFVHNLLRATRTDLNVQIAVHESTLKEYEEVIASANSQFEHMQPTLREVARICLSDGVNPADYFENSIHTDYVSSSLNHIDLGSWQRYMNSISRSALVKVLKSLDIYIDKTSAYVPEEEFNNIRDALRRGSKVQVQRGKRRDIKLDTYHDARIFYIIHSTRKRGPDDDLSLGFDKYLLTLDGSLIFFLKEYGIPWTETYFMFPNQWYELSFPFYRVKFGNQTEFASAIASLVFSPAFPTLAQLLPLELCSYVFDLGGRDLSLASLQETISTAVEGRLMEQLNPSNTDLRGREEATLQVQRIIAENKQKQSGELREAKAKTDALKEESERLEGEIHSLGSKKVELDQRVKDRRARLKKFPTRDAEIAAVREIYEEDIAERDKNFRGLQDDFEGIRNRIASLEDEQGQQEILRQAEEQKQQEERRKQLANVRSFVVTTLMIAGLLVSIALLVDLDKNLWVIIPSLFLMSVGTVLVQRPERSGWAFITYGLGTVSAAYFILQEKNLVSLLWIIPVAWEVIVFGLDKAMGRRFDQIQHADQERD